MKPSKKNDVLIKKKVYIGHPSGDTNIGSLPKKSTSRIGPLKNAQNELTIEPGEQAKISNEYFLSVFTRMNDEPPVTRDMTNGGIKLIQIEIT